MNAPRNELRVSAASFYMFKPSTDYVSDHSKAALLLWILLVIYVCLFVFCCFTSTVNNYGHGGTVSLPNHTFFLGKLEQAVNQYFVHLLSLVTDNNLS